MTNNIKYVKTLTVSDLFDNDNKCNYIIPIYQRNYAWGDNEISSLLQDIKNACEKNKEQDKKYYIGSLVVYRRENDDFEVIDGQQRLTTLTLIMHHLGKLGFRNVFFEHRDESEQALSNLNSEKLPSNFSQALKTIKKVIDEWGNNKDEIVKFLLDKVEIIRTEVPEGTDLNHYFEIMNTRGEQLEKHEILKARLMKELPISEQSLFAKIWDACSDMSRYVVMAFDSELREVILGGDWRKARGFFKTILNENSGESENLGEPENSILKLIDPDVEIEKIEEQSQDKYDGEFTSVIDFPNFLMHVLRIYLERFDKCKYSTKNDPCNVPLDEKLLLKSFEGKFEGKPKKVRMFIYTLLVCRYLFDLYVIKSNMIRTDYENWSLWKIVKGKSGDYYYKNAFGSYKNESVDNIDKNDDESLNDSDPTKKAVMLLSMFHVSNPSRIYKNWLYAVLRWLFDNRDNIEQSDYIKFLEELCDKFYFGNNCQGKDITNIILDKEEICFSSDEKWGYGVSVPNFVFNRLDYQLWQKYKDKYPKFRFTFRSSVEHHYPQHPSEEYGLEKLEQAILDNFGNLYLLSQSKNSRLSNLPPEAKLTYYPNGDYDSLKQALMMEKTKEFNKWKAEEILEHGKEMLVLLNTPIS
ncbi:MULTISPECIES: DUF262 domain-containing protein [Haemophilus]|uniref:DUF262 domain-containing protein n=1 Tax=Haemophilus parainfluenzae TaxID=729 RepID=A0AB37IJ83_HAEPA|nr:MULTISPECIES: DUF262 domain-containing protein [Haemophilus]OFQ18515.1 hypothetical protein HMPREF2948_05515 [Haemophilus sp. HMSC073C03]RDE94036.1 DUF262 domain-containing protein [Haemophilus parainfluenzae]RDF07666.1 DUF262 domain-containing protein [Haemophilus parainfluenzae]